MCKWHRELNVLVCCLSCVRKRRVSCTVAEPSSLRHFVTVREASIIWLCYYLAVKIFYVPNFHCCRPPTKYKNFLVYCTMMLYNAPQNLYAWRYTSWYSGYCGIDILNKRLVCCLLPTVFSPSPFWASLVKRIGCVLGGAAVVVVVVAYLSRG